MVKEQGWKGVVEGHDGTGKSTQVELLAERIRREYGRKVLVLHEPDGPAPICTYLRTGIKDGSMVRPPKTNVLMFTASRVASHEVAQEFMAEGGVALAARDYDSTKAYQGGGEGLDLEYIEQISRLSLPQNYFAPAFKVILTLSDPKERIDRIDRRGQLETPDTFEMRDADFQKRVDAMYFALARENSYPLIDSRQSPEAVHEEIMELIWLKGLLPRP
jgi:dTMP kinase